MTNPPKWYDPTNPPPDDDFTIGVPPDRQEGPIECEMEVFGHCGPFDDELLTGRLDEAVERIRGMDPIQAVQLILATYCRSDSVIERRELDDLAEFMGVFADDE